MNPGSGTETVECWGIWELILEGPKKGNPFTEVEVKARFNFRHREVEADGFYDGDGIYRIRFMPDAPGVWTYTTQSNFPGLSGISGEFACTPPAPGNHGPVRVRQVHHFAYEDGTPYYPVGTTCYAWIHQGDSLEEETLLTLKNAPFNKIRMCVFPKDYDFNHNEPVYYPYEGAPPKEWNFTRFNPAFFRHLERRIGDLLELGIEADVILFHPYDRWGFSDMGPEADGRYLRYIVARLAAYRNVWWSMANEFDIMLTKKEEDWDRFFRIVAESDPYQRLRSIHNCVRFYDHGKPWVTHASIQRTDLYRTSENTGEWRNYRKPVVIDECAYEGDINHGWGNITGEEMTRRFWEGAVRGGYVGHGETYMHPEEILWWSKGGKLHGKSPKRIAFLRKIMEEGPWPLEPFYFQWDAVCGGKQGEYYLVYFGFNQPSFRVFELPAENSYKIDVIDTWEMTVTSLPGTFSGRCEVKLPGKPYMALRIQKK
ncbi:MAG: DUF5605 domain-containing protein [Bacillota bacterium]